MTKNNDMKNFIKTSPGAPCIDVGIAISNNGPRDFWGTALFKGLSDIGAVEFDK